MDGHGVSHFQTACSKGSTLSGGQTDAQISARVAAHNEATLASRTRRVGWTERDYNAISKIREAV
jgi:hypothetical protein